MKKSTRYLFLAASILATFLSWGIFLFALLKQKMWLIVALFVLFLIYGAVVYAFRHKVAQSSIQLPENVKQKQTAVLERLLKTLKLSLLGLPVCFIMIPHVLEDSASAYFFHEGFVPSVISMILFYGMVWELYLIVRWIVKRLKTSEISPGSLQG